LRALEPFDLELLYIWENNTEIWEVGNTLTPFSRFVLHQYLENSHRDIQETKQLRLIIELKKDKPYVPIGIIDLFDIDFYNQRAAIGILIADEKHRNKGYASNAIDLIEEYALKKLDFKQLHCKIACENKTSLKLFQSKGYHMSGKLLKWQKTNSGLKDIIFLQHFLE
jgi:diamine N-acetyltransferase